MKRKETEKFGGVLLEGDDLNIERIKKEMVNSCTMALATYDNGDKKIVLLCVSRLDQNTLINIAGEIDTSGDKNEFSLEGVMSIQFKIKPINKTW